MPVANPNALAGAITRVLKNDALRWELERNSQRIAQNYSWHNISCQVFDLYTAVIAARDARREAVAELLPAL